MQQWGLSLFLVTIFTKDLLVIAKSCPVFLLVYGPGFLLLTHVFWTFFLWQVDVLFLKVSIFCKHSVSFLSLPVCVCLSCSALLQFYICCFLHANLFNAFNCCIGFFFVFLCPLSRQGRPTSFTITDSAFFALGQGLVRPPMGPAVISITHQGYAHTAALGWLSHMMASGLNHIFLFTARCPMTKHWEYFTSKFSLLE